METNRASYHKRSRSVSPPKNPSHSSIVESPRFMRKSTGYSNLVELLEESTTSHQEEKKIRTEEK